MTEFEMTEPESPTPVNEAEPTPVAPAGDKWLTPAEAAEALGTTTSQIKRMLNDGELLAVTVDAVRKIPADLIVGGEVSRYLSGIITLLRDGGYDDDDAVSWLLRVDESLGGNAALGLHKQLHREVSRRAQALAF